MTHNFQEAIAIYKASQPLEEQLPKEASQFGFILEKVQGHCPQCGRELIGLRGTIVDQGQCLEVRSIGVCQAEKSLVQMKIVRYYADGRLMWYDGKDGWMQSQDDGLWENFCGWLRKIRKNICG